MRYFGFYAQHKGFVDNRDDCREYLENPELYKVMFRSAEEAQEQLNFLNRFDPEKPHSRLVAHKVDVYSIEKPTWNITRRNARPCGKLKNVFSVDLGKMIMEECTGEKEEILNENYVHILPDGTEIRGVLVRTTRNKGLPNNRIVENPYLDMTYDSSYFKNTGEFHYNFDIKRDDIDLGKILIYRVLKYVDIDGQRILERLEIATPIFDLIDERPNEFIKLDYTHPKIHRKLLFGN